MPHTRLRPAFTFTEERLAELRRVVPEAFADGRVNWDALREALGTHLEPDEAGAEHFGLFWPGKREARRLAAVPSRGTLVPAPGEGVDEDTTRNVFIEGDNLEVLKLLQKSYAGRVKMIYIDPPYNTGSDLVYRDDFSESREGYLRRSGDIDEAGDALTTNTKADGRYHSNWLSMMYPRLRLAWGLLRDDGVLFASIDNNEVHHLRAILNEVFGEENFLGCIVRATGTTTGQDGGAFGSSFDYMLAYSKSDSFQLGGFALSEDDALRFNEQDARGAYSTLQLRKTGNADRRADRPSMYYPLPDPDGNDVYPIGPGGYESRWRCGKDTLAKMQADDLIVWKRVKRDGAEQWAPYVKYYLEGREKRPSPLWVDIEGNKKATNEVKELVGPKVFSNPKPTEAICRVIQLATEKDTEDVVLDFFAGSGTTAHAVFVQNRNDGGNRRFICIQYPERVAPESGAAQAGFDNIAEICKQRIRAAAQKLAGQRDLKHEDLGFRVLRRESSSFSEWTDVSDDDLTALELQLDTAESPLVDGWRSDNVLVEVMLTEGFPLDSAVTPRKAGRNRATLVESEHRAHKLAACFDVRVDAALPDALGLAESDVFVCLDTALDDAAKLRLAERCHLKTI